MLADITQNVFADSGKQDTYRASSKPTVRIAGLGCETSPILAPAFHPQRGEEIVDNTYQLLCRGTHLGDAANCCGSFVRHALPSDIVE